MLAHLKPNNCSSFVGWTYLSFICCRPRAAHIFDVILLDFSDFSSLCVLPKNLGFPCLRFFAVQQQNLKQLGWLQYIFTKLLCHPTLEQFELYSTERIVVIFIISMLFGITTLSGLSLTLLSQHSFTWLVRLMGKGNSHTDYIYNNCTFSKISKIQIIVNCEQLFCRFRPLNLWKMRLIQHISQLKQVHIRSYVSFTFIQKELINIKS